MPLFLLLDITSSDTDDLDSVGLLHNVGPLNVDTFCSTVSKKNAYLLTTLLISSDKPINIRKQSCSQWEVGTFSDSSLCLRI